MQPKYGPGLLGVIFLEHLWTSNQHVAVAASHTTRWTQQTNIRGVSEIRNRDSSNKPTALESTDTSTGMKALNIIDQATQT
jgi:hypothetical protein